LDFYAFPNLVTCVATRDASLRTGQPLPPELDVKIS
jgi:hypothetical protein